MELSFHGITFGCQMNVNDSAWLSRALQQKGWIEKSMKEADIVFVNTCSVREKPEHKLYSTLGMIRKFNPKALIAVAGCVAQQAGEKIWEKHPQVRLVLGTDGIVHAPDALVRLLEKPGLRLTFLEFTDIFSERPSMHLETNTSTSTGFVNITQGCGNYCAYCIVPYTRGACKSRPTQAVLDECQQWLDVGVKELILLGQNVNAFGKDKNGDGTNFSQLLHKVAKMKGLERLQLVTPHPRDFCDESIQAFGDLPVLTPRLHLPLQAGSDKILKSMGRGYTMEHYYNIVEKLLKVRPDIVFSTDIIIGFPGETEEDFQGSLDAINRVGFISSFSYVYSDRPGTRASKMTNKIPDDLKADRLNRLQSLQDEHSVKWLKSLEGKDTTILLEAPSRRQPDNPDRLATTSITDTTDIALAKKPTPSAIDNPTSNVSGDIASEITNRINDEIESTGIVTSQIDWRGRDPWGNIVNISLSNVKAGMYVPVHVQRAKKHSLMAVPIEKGRL